jgi:dihydroxyacid dehydratase/phosphogluconate dehydratase
MVESVYGDSHPGSYHLIRWWSRLYYGVYEKGGKPAKYNATDICDGCTRATTDELRPGLPGSHRQHGGNPRLRSGPGTA